MKHLVFYLMVISIVPAITSSLKSVKNRRLCPTTTKAACDSASKFNCLYTRGRLLDVQCVQRVANCDLAWKTVCRPPLTPSCRSRPAECVCTCVLVKPRPQKGTAKNRG
ncbi:hypothetical protein MTO96_015849 [Rhipicephalus appendiculatus]